ncbi:MAG TPA: hemerythrin domain-containing protein [Vicinamibacterales bacterium]|nr:hemerythrin domain-containing protein [Vicinamibacterales bacterium]
MRRFDRRGVLRVIAGTAGLAAVSRWAAAGQPKGEGGKAVGIKAPGSVKAEHDELHEELVQATKAGGETGEAARAVAKVLHPHFLKEEELAMPPLGLLPALAGGAVPPAAARVVELTDRLKKELPAMLEEHRAIVAALEKLAGAAMREGKPPARHLAEKLKQHAKTEEEVLYPAAILVGEYVKLRLRK